MGNAAKLRLIRSRDADNPYSMCPLQNKATSSSPDQMTQKTKTKHTVHPKNLNLTIRLCSYNSKPVNHGHPMLGLTRQCPAGLTCNEPLTGSSIKTSNHSRKVCFRNSCWETTRQCLARPYLQRAPSEYLGSTYLETGNRATKIEWIAVGLMGE
ncbi:hypothetical protein K435DRAFT_403647 [Dendrothele bispora CBS 962.96]|uniref:Uncharacterized protein n=1 Tax=Dendrothele bispora (strain CBS 962.96) TaxID=1314807 RepID=A0A4S8L8G8_DENBC|nr:hypothetical protein K435DRAFT_403647 [Dendrothele bispora CBS 962.96]